MVGLCVWVFCVWVYVLFSFWFVLMVIGSSINKTNTYSYQVHSFSCDSLVDKYPGNGFA